jgi:site-specific DNA-methyltransferase (adenine-specific)
MKPIELLSKAISNSSKEEEHILDLFGGSGSTLIACEQLNRKCFMMEIDPIYCSVIIERWEKLTGQKAEKIN